MTFASTISLAWRNIRGNKLRTGITVAIIALGIFTLIAIVTAIAAMSQKFTESFSTMGANGFSIRYKERNIQFGNGDSEAKVTKKGAKKEKQSSLGKRITLEEGEAFINAFTYPATAGLSITVSRNATLTYGSKKTSPDVALFGADENYAALNGFTVQYGRMFSKGEVQSAQPVCVVGYDVATRFFKGAPDAAEGKVIRVDGKPFRVVGVYASRGSSFGFSRDKIVVCSYKAADRFFNPRNSFAIGVLTADVKQVDAGMGEAEGTFRSVRRLLVTEESNFVLDRSDSVAAQAMSVLGTLTTAVIVIGLITLIGSAIGLMNIMLVSVTERTKEVGLIKAIGGKKASVQGQFLSEAILLSLLGAAFGIVFGILAGNGIALAMGTGFLVPWGWVGAGVGICTVVGLVAGMYPARKAGKLNPIEALRYE